MSFLIKNPNATPGVAIFRPNTNASNSFSFQEGTFREIGGNGSTILQFEGGYRYFIEHDFASSNTTSAVLLPIFSVSRYYGGAVSIQLYSRAYSSNPGQDQRWYGSVTIDAVSDIGISSSAVQQSQSSTITVWRFPL